MNPNISALTIYNGELIAGGDFTKAGSVTAKRIASWNSSDWQALASGMDADVMAPILKLDASSQAVCSGFPMCTRIRCFTRPRSSGITPSRTR